jgi:hypothetical protein
MMFNYPYSRSSYASYSPSDFSDVYNKGYTNFRKSKYNNYSYEISKKHPTSKLEIPEKAAENNTRQSFQIMGITLYFDDILLICLIFFLYSEGIEDQSLFLSLILLLLS